MLFFSFATLDTTLRYDKTEGATLREGQLDYCRPEGKSSKASPPRDAQLRGAAKLLVIYTMDWPSSQ